MSRTTRALALTAVLAGASALVALPADAAPAVHCSKYLQAGSTKVYVRECAQLVKTVRGVRTIAETATLLNKGTKSAKVTGFFAVSWGQAGTGAPFATQTVAAGKTKTVSTSFKVDAAGPYTATASATVAGKTAARSVTFSK